MGTICFYICWKYNKSLGPLTIVWGFTINVVFRKVLNWDVTSEFSYDYFIFTKLYNIILVYKVYVIYSLEISD